MSRYKLNGVNFMYGAIMYNNGTVTFNTSTRAGGSSSYPFFTSRSDLSTISQQTIDDNWLVMPGFKLVVYTSTSFGGTSTTYDNTTGFRPVRYYASRNTNSIRLYFNNVELSEPT